MRWIVYRWIWNIARGLFAIATVLLGLPSDKLALVVGVTLAQWIQWPPILVPVVALLTAMILYEFLSWLSRSSAMRLANPTRDWSMQDFVRYLGSEAKIAYEFDDYRLWDQETCKRIQDALADEAGSLASWGRPLRTVVMIEKLMQPERLDHSYWVHQELDWASCICDGHIAYPHGAQTWVAMNQNQPRYDLHVNKFQATRLFPRASIFERFHKRSHVSYRPPQRVEVRDKDEIHIWESLDGHGQATIIKPRSDQVQ